MCARPRAGAFVHLPSLFSAREDLMTRPHAETIRVIDSTSRMGLKAPSMLTFLLSLVIMMAVLFAKYFGASIPGLTGDVTQFAGLLVAYVLLLMGCLFRSL
jgi:hypothetical protein